MEKPLALLKSLSNAENVIIYSSPFDIGRSRIAKLIIPHVNISRNHCQLICSEDQKWIVEDLSSSGTFINNELIGKGSSGEIKDNDVIRLGPEDCNFKWEFITNVERIQTTKQNSGFMDIQSQAIVDMCNEKDTLQRQIILNRESCLKMKLKKEELHQQCLSQFKMLDNRLLSASEKLKIQSDEIQNTICKQMEEEMKKVHIQIEKELLDLQTKITESDKKEEELKLEVQKLQEKLISEQIQWENKFLEERKKLQDKISEQNEKLAIEKVKMEEISIAHEQELEDKLKKEEEEKKILIGKLREMEEAKKILSEKLKESDESHLLEKARLEEEMRKQLLKREEDMKALLQERTDCYQNYQIQASSNPKAGESANNEDLLKELDEVKSILITSDSKQKLLEKGLAAINSLKDQASRVKSNVLENMADLMESELQCSICSELFVIATTLNCTHTFCKYCIDTWKRKKKSCPICRKKITSENRSIVMDNYIDKMVENLSEDFKSRRRTVIEERKCEIPCKVSKSTAPSPESNDGNQPTTSARRRSTQSSRRRNRRQVSLNSPVEGTV